MNQQRDERYRVPGSEILDVDTWAEDSETCPECGVAVTAEQSRCDGCGQWLERCSGSCPSCASPRCVGGRRPKSDP